MAGEASDKKIKSYCRVCNNSTHHTVHSRQSKSYGDEYHGETRYLMVGCCGCDTISFRKEDHDFESAYQVADDEWDYDMKVHIYPPVIENHQVPSETWLIPPIVLSIYLESLEAIKNDSRILAGLGFRGTIEAICINQGISGKDLSAKISNLSRQGLISKSDANLLHSIRFLGNDAAHEISKATPAQLRSALGIIDHLLRSLYIVKNTIEGLEGVIDTYPDFIKLLEGIVSKSGLSVAQPLAQILGRSKRRILSDLPVFEKQLIDDVKSGAVNWLALGPLQKIGSKEKAIDVQLFDGVKK